MVIDRRYLVAGAAVLAGAALTRPACAQDYPQRPVRMIVPYAPGGASDILARLIQPHLDREFGQAFIVDNRGGGASQVGTQAIATAAPDGYTIGVIDSAFVINPGLFAGKLPYDTQRDFAPVSLLATTPLVLVVHPSVPANTAQELVALAKAKPGEITFASAGLGTAIHLAGEQFRQVAGIDINHIPYRGGGPALNDVIGGQVKFFFSNGSASIGQVQAGAVKAIAHTGKGRLRTLPDLPPVSDTIPGFEAYEWNGVFVPTGTSPEIVKKLNAGLNEVLRQPDIVARFKSLNIDFKENTPQEFRSFVVAETEKWGKVVRSAGIKPD